METALLLFLVELFLRFNVIFFVINSYFLDILFVRSRNNLNARKAKKAGLNPLFMPPLYASLLTLRDTTAKARKYCKQKTILIRHAHDVVLLSDAILTLELKWESQFFGFSMIEPTEPSKFLRETLLYGIFVGLTSSNEFDIVQKPLLRSFILREHQGRYGKRLHVDAKNGSLGQPCFTILPCFLCIVGYLSPPDEKLL